MKAFFAICILAMVFFSAYLLTALSSPDLSTSGSVAKEIDYRKLKVATLADCAEKDERVVCEDTIYYMCNNLIRKVQGNIITCNGIDFSIDTIKLRKSEFAAGWRDPREAEWLRGISQNPP